MPIYEYECGKCGRVLKFLVRSVAGHVPPACPKCGQAGMKRVLSGFATPKGTRKSAPESAPAAAGDDMPPGMDRMMAEAEGIDENDPRAMGRFMRKMAEQTGEPMPAEMNEVVRRLEAGEDPERIEEQMGDVMDDEGGGPGGTGGGEDTLYDA